MRTGLKFSSYVVLGILCLSSLNWADTSPRAKRKAKKPAVPTLPSGPQGPVPQVPLDSTPAVAPHVSYTDGQLTIIAPNSTLGDILRAVKKQTAADMDIPANVNERVVTQLGPGPAREVVADLLNGSHFNYVLLGSPAQPNVLTRVVLVAKAKSDAPPAASAQPGVDQAGNQTPPQAEEPEVAESQEAETPEEPVDENADQTAETDQEQAPATPADQQAIKTPQQMLQEMQQRQLQLQQQQPPGQPPIPGGGYPQVPRQQQDPPQQ